ncbi:hypothetical protein MBLNU459_g7755t1, partial [Dothideomycetes sp. NU459]
MRSSSLVVLAAATAGIALAQSTTTSSAAASGYSCAAQTVLDACVSQLQPYTTECTGNDWNCLCNSWTNLQTCYNNCPGDPKAYSVGQSKSTYCQAAAV